MEIRIFKKINSWYTGFFFFFLQSNPIQEESIDIFNMYIECFIYEQVNEDWVEEAIGRYIVGSFIF